MSDYRINPSEGPRESGMIKGEKAHAQKDAGERLVQAESMETSMIEWAQEGFNPVAMTRRFRTLDEQRTSLKKEKTGDDTQSKKLLEIKEKEELAQFFQNQNNEFQKKTLLILRERLRQGDTAEDILRKVLDVYPDYTLADEALDFLSQTSDGALRANVLRAKEALNAYYKREIVAGKNINEQAQLFSKEGLGSPTALRDMYRDITGNPRTPNTLFEELSQKFDFESLNKVLEFLLHSLGSDLKAKGPSISRAELKRLIDDARSMQAILGVYLFFRSRMALMRGQFDRYDMRYPEEIDFEILAKRFMELLKERYISPERIFQQARKLNISEDIITQIVIFTQMRDGVRGVATRLYRNDQHRQEVLQALIEALEELEDQLMEEEENE